MSRRQDIEKLLEGGPVSAKSIANRLGIQLKVVFEDLNHIKKSVEAQGKNFNIIPAHCKKCGFVFKERERIKTPSKCPRCNSEWIEKEKFSVE